MSSSQDTIQVRLLDGTRRHVPRACLPAHVVDNAARRGLRSLSECKFVAGCPHGLQCCFVHQDQLPSAPAVAAAAPAAAPAVNAPAVAAPHVPPPAPAHRAPAAAPAPPTYATALAGPTSSCATDDASHVVLVRRVHQQRGSFDEVRLSSLVDNPASRFLVENSFSNPVGRECRGHAPHSRVTAETCSFVHFKAPAAASAAALSAPAAPAVSVAAPAVVVNVPPPSCSCCVCGEEVLAVATNNNSDDAAAKKTLLPHVSCRRGHNVCAECLVSYINRAWVHIPVAVGTVPVITCLQDGCDDVEPLTRIAVARACLLSCEDAAAGERALESYLTAQSNAREALLCAEAVEAMRREAATATSRVDMMVLARAVGRHAYMCRSCGYAPVMLSGCSDLMAHHGDVLRDGERAISNACPGCQRLSTTIDEGFMRWDGTVRTTEQERAEGLRIVSERRGRGRGFGGRGFGRGFGGRGMGRGAMPAAATPAPAAEAVPTPGRRPYRGARGGIFRGGRGRGQQ
jgi:hypothetical protein